MVNNNFNFIGVAVSGFENIGNGTHTSYMLRVEIEKIRAKKGAQPFQLEVQIYETNTAINTKQDILGEQVAVCGYLDSYTSKDGNLIMKLVAQNVLILRNENSRISNRFDDTNDTSIQNIADSLPDLPADISDEGLPF